jgi:hypothetical protein
VADLLRNRRPISRGTGGRFHRNNHSHSKDGLCIGYTESKDKEITITELEEMVRTDHADPGYKSRQKNLPISLAKLPKIGKKILALKEISKERYKEISEHEPHYRNLKLEHRHIEKIQKILRKLLDDILQTPLLSNSKMLQNILLRYNETPKSKVYLSDDGMIKEYPPFSKEIFLNRKIISLDLEQIYNGPISCCVVEFLRNSKNIRYLKQCKQCNDFFIARHASRQFCNEPKKCKKIFFDKYRKRLMKEEYRNPSSPKFKVDYLR